MRKKIIILIYLIVLFILLFYSRSEQLDIFVLGGDFLDLLLIFSIWSVLSILLYLLIKKRKKSISNVQFFTFWIIILICASINFQIIKYNPHPYDTFYYKWRHKDLIERKRINDSIGLYSGKPDSTIETTIASIDSNDVGVYIWLNHKSIFVRKLTPELKSQRENDSLTMSIVRKWKKE